MAFFVFPDAFPRTPNGKVDRKALPPPPTTAAVPFDSSATTRRTGPRTAMERAVAQACAEVLGVTVLGGEEEGEEIGEKEGQYFVDQATGQYYFQTSDGETMTVVSAPGVEEPSKLIYNFVHSFG